MNISYLPVISLALMAVIVCFPFSKENQVFLSTTGMLQSPEIDGTEDQKKINIKQQRKLSNTIITKSWALTA